MQKYKAIHILLFLVFLNVSFFFLLPHYIYSNSLIEPWFNYKGLLFYRDIASFHFPLARWIIIPIYTVMDWNLEAGPITGLIINITTLLILYNFLKENKYAFIISSLFFSTLYWYFTTSGIMYFHEMLIGAFLLAAFVISLKIYFSKIISKKILLMAGTLLSLAELSGQIASLTIGVNCAFLLYILYSQTNSLKKTIQYANYIFIGFVTPFIGLIIYFWHNNAIDSLYYWNIYYYQVYASYPKESLAIIKDNWKDITAFYIPSILIIVLFFSKKIHHKVLLIWLEIFYISSIPFILFSAYHPHHYNYFLPIVSSILGILIFNFKVHTNNKYLFSLLSLFYFFYITIMIYPWYSSKLQQASRISGVANDVKEDEPMYLAIEWIKDNTTPDTKILVVGDTLFYFRSNRLPANSRSQGVPLMYDPLEDTKKEMAKKPPEYWIIDKDFIKTRVINAYQRSDVLEFINYETESCYNLIKTFQTWEIWKNKC